MVSFFQAIRQKSSNHIATKVKKHLSIKHLRLQGNNKNKIEEFKDNMNIDVLRIGNNSLSMIDIIPVIRRIMMKISSMKIMTWH